MSFLFSPKMGEKSKKGQKSHKNARKMEKSFLARRGYPKSFLRLGATLPKFLRKKFLRKKKRVFGQPLTAGGQILKILEI